MTDLVRLDRDIAALMQENPLAIDWDAHRHVSGQRALREVEAESGALRDALQEWVSWLTAQRVSQPRERALAELRAATRATVRLRRDTQMTEREMLAGLLAARTPKEALDLFEPWRGVHEAFTSAERAVHETRTEAFKRLGIDDVPLRFVGAARADLCAAAERFLGATNDLAESLCERAFPLDIDVRLARGATEGWPSRLTWRTAASLMAGFVTPRGARLPECPAAVGAASYARAVASLGDAFRRSASAESMPFVMRSGPLFVDVHRTAMIFATAMAERAFHVRVLGLAPGRARDQARVMVAAFLFDARLLALRVALERPADAEGLSMLALGTHIPGWPPPRDEDAARFVAFATTLERMDALRAREGDDWFRNPRAFATLYDLVQVAIKPSTDTIGAGTVALAHRFEELLG